MNVQRSFPDNPSASLCIRVDLASDCSTNRYRAIFSSRLSYLRSDDGTFYVVNRNLSIVILVFCSQFGATISEIRFGVILREGRNK